MANPNKDKGDRAEREAVAVLVEAAGDLCMEGAQRKLGAGRKEDTGDLYVFADTAVQVKWMKNIGSAIREAAAGAAMQARHGRVPFALGMTPVTGARTGTVRWLACAAPQDWPDQSLAGDEVARFATPAALVAHLRNEKLGIPRTRRIALLDRSNAPLVVVSPIEAWLAAYRVARQSHRLSISV